MTVKSGLEKIFLKFLHAQSPFMESIFTKKNRGFFHKIVNSVIKSIFFIGISMNLFVMYLHIINETL